jgi:excisionase family DNA binding protein
MLTAKQAAERIGGVSVSLVYELCRKRRLRHARIGVGRGRIMIPEDAITEFLSASEVKPFSLPAAGRLQLNAGRGR